VASPADPPYDGQYEPVVLPWLAALPWKQQSAYFSALRGPDHAHCHMVKQCTKLLRVASQKDADPASNYMRAELPRSTAEWRQLEHELEYCSLHFVAHLVQALYLLALRGPQQHKDDAQALLAWFEDTYHMRYAHA
jgi:hypothetical protein